MIRKTIKKTIDATFIVRCPNPNKDNFPEPKGTGFFISPTGYFITANHVVKDVVEISKIILKQPLNYGNGFVRRLRLIKSWENFDIALLKAEFNSDNKTNFEQKGKLKFPYIEINFDEQIEGTPVYSFGYPLPKSWYGKINGPGLSEGGFMIGFDKIFPRVTSAIISSNIYTIERGREDKRFFTLDKFLTNGYSGAPIVLQEDGKVIGVNIQIELQHLQINNKTVYIPISYGVATKLLNIRKELEKIILEENQK